MPFQDPEPKLKYSENSIFVTSHFGTLFASGIPLSSAVKITKLLRFLGLRFDYKDSNIRNLS